MATERSAGQRIGHFLLFLLLAIVTLGLYPLYFWVSRTEEQNMLLAEILAELKRRPLAS